MSNQQRPFSWFRLAPFGRQLQPALTPIPRPTPLGAPAPQPFRPRPTIRPPAPAVTSPPPPPPPPAVAVPARTLFSGVTTTATTAQPAPRPATTSTAPASPAKSVSIPASPITKQASFSSSPTSPTILPITSSSFNFSSPEKRTPAPNPFSLTASPFPKQVASPPKSTPSAATIAATTTITAPTTAPSAAPTAPTTTTTTTITAPTTTSSPRIIKTLKESPPKHPETSSLIRPPSAPARAAPEKELPKGAPMEQEIKKQMQGQEMAGNSKMNEKAADLKKLPRRLVTLIGKNKGAIAVLNSNSAKKSYNGFPGKPQTVGNKEEAHNGEAGSKKKEKSHDMNTMEMEPSTLFINSNVQGVNNSILDDSSLTHHDPGFHLFFSTD